MFCFEILGLFGENRKCAKTGKFGHYRAPTPQRSEPTLRCRPMPRCGIPSSWRGRGAKMAPLGYEMPRRGVATVHNEQFLDCCSKSLVFVHRLFRDPNKILMGVRIRVYERENVPYLATKAKRSFALAIFVYYD